MTYTLFKSGFLVLIVKSSREPSSWVPMFPIILFFYILLFKILIHFLFVIELDESIEGQSKCGCGRGFIFDFSPFWAEFNSIFM